MINSWCAEGVRRELKPQWLSKLCKLCCIMLKAAAMSIFSEHRRRMMWNLVPSSIVRRRLFGMLEQRCWCRLVRHQHRCLRRVKCVLVQFVKILWQQRRIATKGLKYHWDYSRKFMLCLCFRLNLHLTLLSPFNGIF